MRKKGWRYWFNLLIFGLSSFSIVVVMAIAQASYRSAASYMHPQRRQRPDSETPELYGIRYEDVRLVANDGIELAAWYIPPENGALILVAHGYGDTRSASWFALFAQNGYGVLAWDFRAHGESEGDLCTLGYYEALDVEAALEFGMQQPGVEHIGAWGGSMGGVAVIEASSRREEIEAVAVDSAFPTLEDELGMAVRSGVFRPFIRLFAEMETRLDMDMLRPVERIGEISPRPVMIIQGEADGAIPEDSAKRLYESAGEPRYLWTEAGVGHVGMFGAYPEEYEERVVGFFDELLLHSQE